MWLGKPDKEWEKGEVKLIVRQVKLSVLSKVWRGPNRKVWGWPNEIDWVGSIQIVFGWPAEVFWRYQQLWGI